MEKYRGPSSRRSKRVPASNLPTVDKFQTDAPAEMRRCTFEAKGARVCPCSILGGNGRRVSKRRRFIRERRRGVGGGPALPRDRRTGACCCPRPDGRDPRNLAARSSRSTPKASRSFATARRRRRSSAMAGRVPPLELVPTGGAGAARGAILDLALAVRGRALGTLRIVRGSADRRVRPPALRGARAPHRGRARHGADRDRVAPGRGHARSARSCRSVCRAPTGTGSTPPTSRARPSRSSAATGTTPSPSPTDGSRSRSATSPATGSLRRS